MTVHHNSKFSLHIIFIISIIIYYKLKKCMEYQYRSFLHRVYTNQMNSRFIFVQGVQHNLTVSIGFVCQLHFSERYRFFHPMRSKIWTLRMDVNRIWWGDFRFSAWDPFPVNVFPSINRILNIFKQYRQFKRRETSNKIFNILRNISAYA